jgi:hypothetical protein
MHDLYQHPIRRPSRQLQPLPPTIASIPIASGIIITNTPYIVVGLERLIGLTSSGIIGGLAVVALIREGAVFEGRNVDTKHPISSRTRSCLANMVVVGFHHHNKST